MLARYLRPLEDSEFKAGNWEGSKETEPGVLTFPCVTYSDLVGEFVQSAYDDGWVMTDFDWPKWIASKEAKTLGKGGVSLKRATPQQLARMLTAIIRQDRFMEGALLGAFKSELILGIVRRAAALADAIEAKRAISPNWGER